MGSTWIPNSLWADIVSHVPIVSVDLVVHTPDGVVLGKRANEPAKGEWFVPGGRIHKNERLIDAANRIAAEELGVETVQTLEMLGAYEHIYDTGGVDGGSKHYLANGFVVETDTTVGEMSLDEQHTNVRGFESGAFPADLHEYAAAYLRDAESVAYPVDGDN